MGRGKVPEIVLESISASQARTDLLNHVGLQEAIMPLKWPVYSCG